MVIDPLTIVLGLWSMLLTIFLGGLSWLVNRVFKLLDDLRIEDDRIKSEITRHYTRRDDFMNFQKQIIEFLRRIEDKVDGKQDKKG